MRSVVPPARRDLASDTESIFDREALRAFAHFLRTALSFLSLLESLLTILFYSPRVAPLFSPHITYPTLTRRLIISPQPFLAHPPSVRLHPTKREPDRSA